MLIKKWLIFKELNDTLALLLREFCKHLKDCDKGNVFITKGWKRDNN